MRTITFYLISDCCQLMLRLASSPPWRFRKNVTLGRAALGGQECYLLESNDPDSDYAEIWICDDFMKQKLRKVERMPIELQLQLFRDAAAVIPAIGLREPINDLESFTDYHYSDIEISF